MIFLFDNFAESNLASSISTGDTSLSVTAGDGALFPTPVALTSHFYIYVIEGSTVEWMICTARSSDIFTVTRADSPSAFTTSAKVQMRMKQEILESFLQKGNERSVAGSPNTLGTTALYNGEEVMDSVAYVWYKNTPGGTNTWES